MAFPMSQQGAPKTCPAEICTYVHQKTWILEWSSQPNSEELKAGHNPHVPQQGNTQVGKCRFTAVHMENKRIKKNKSKLCFAYSQL